MHLFFSSLSDITWSCLSFVKRDGSTPCPPLGVPDAQFNECGRRVGMNTLPWCLHRQGSHLIPSPPSANANRSFQPPPLLSALPLLWLQKALVCPRSSIPSLQSLAVLKKFSISFWSIQPRVWNRAGERAPDLNLQHCSTLCSLWFLPARTTCPAHPHLTADMSNIAW